MALSARIRELVSRHRELDDAIDTEARRPGADPVHLADLKRRKLRLKEELESLRARAPA